MPVLIAVAGQTAVAKKSNPPQTNAPLTVEPVDAELVLAREKSTKVRISLSSALAVDASARPTITASVGRVGEVEVLGPRQFELVYFTPESKPPAAAILVVRLDTPSGAVFGAASIRLLGKARVSVKTEKNARVHIKIAGKLEGPFQADAKGIVETSLTVPPGVDTFQTIAVDRAGNRSVRRKTLNVPPFPLVAFGPAPAEIAADGRTPLVLGVAAVSLAGELVAWRGKCQASAGKLTPQEPHNGVGRLQYRISTVGAGAARITCGREKSKGESASLELVLVPGPVHVLELLGPASCVTGATCPLELAARDEAGNRIIDLPNLGATTDLGAISQQGKDETGRTIYLFAAPENVSPGQAASVTLTDPASGSQASGTIRLASATVAELAFVHDGEASVLAGDELAIPLLAVDAFGNPVALESIPSLSVRLGEAVWVAEEEGGRPTVIYRSPAGAGDVEDRVELSYGGLTAELPVQIQSRWRRTHLSTRAGVLVMGNMMAALSIAVDVTTALPLLDGRFAVSLRLLGARAYRETPLVLNDTQVGRTRQTLWLLPAFASFDTRIIAGESFDLDLGASGGGLFFWSSLVSRGDASSIPPDRHAFVVSPAVGLHLRVGYDVGAGSIEAGVDGTWAWTRPANTIRGDLFAVNVSAGWRFNWEAAIW